MGRLTTHVLDIAVGKPASGLRIELFRAGEMSEPLAAAVTNQDGRVERPLVEGDAFSPGVYEIRFHVGEYLRRSGAAVREPPFLDVVPIRFGVAAGEHYHVPLLLSPYGYSTYRGS